MSKIKSILRALKNGTLTTFEIIDISHSETYGVRRRKALGYMEVPKFNYQEWKRQEEKKFYTLLSHLRKDGLIEKERVNQQSIWSITKKGLRKFKIINNKPSLQPPKKVYGKEIDDNWNLVIFDIPEKLKYKRVWLRGQLTLLGFSMLQESVWISKYKIPENFIQDLKDFKILPHIHILKVYKKGSLMSIKL